MPSGSGESDGTAGAGANAGSAGGTSVAVATGDGGAAGAGAGAGAGAAGAAGAATNQPPSLAPPAAAAALAGDTAHTGADGAGCYVETPWHDRDPFSMQLLAPSAFRQLWSQFGITAADLTTAICSQPLLEISNPGASGSEFYRSSDDQFFLKSVSSDGVECGAVSIWCS